MVVLLGRTRLALVGSLLLAPSLTLVPLGNWWTAGVNILPALVGFYVAFGAMVQLLRGRSRLWALACFAGAAVGVLDYELPMLLCGYLGLWVLLFGRRVTGEPLVATVRRTWWVLARGDRHRRRGRAELPAQLLRPGAPALGGRTWCTRWRRSLVRTLIPTTVGFHDPHSDAFSALSLVIGCVGLVALVAWLGLTRTGAWRGLLFAGAGWLLPTLALVLNRVSIFGVGVVDNAIYFHLPTVLFVIGLLEAWRSPRRRPATVRPGPTARRVLVPFLLISVVAAYAWSAGPTSRYQLPAGASPDFVDRARASAAGLRAAGDPFTVINADVPGSVAPEEFDPYNRAAEVLAVAVPPLDFDRPEPPYYRVSASGDLEPVVDIDRIATGTPAPGDLRLLDARRDPESEPGRPVLHRGRVLLRVCGRCPAPWRSALDLVVRTLAEVDGETTVRVVVRPEGETGFEAARTRTCTRSARTTRASLDTVDAPSVSAVRVRGFTPGTHVCVTSVSVGRVVPAG